MPAARAAFEGLIDYAGLYPPASLPLEIVVRNFATYRSGAHGWMLGFVYAVANPYYALTAEDGTFEIAEVPPGDYTLIANQAYTGPIEVDVTVKAGETAEVPVELAAP